MYATNRAGDHTCWRERDLMKEGKPPGCCDKPNCPWKHANDPKDSGPQVGAAAPVLDDPTSWAVCRHIVDPTKYGSCPDPKECGRSYCPQAAAFIRKQVHPDTRNSGTWATPRRQTPERNRRSPGPRNDRRTPSGGRGDRRDRDRSDSRRSSREGRGDRRGEERSSGRDRRTSRGADPSPSRTRRETRPERPDIRGLPGAGAAALGAADNGETSSAASWEAPRGPGGDRAVLAAGRDGYAKPDGERVQAAQGRISAMVECSPSSQVSGGCQLSDGVQPYVLLED